jgi:hypothetical protein
MIIPIVSPFYLFPPRPPPYFSHPPSLSPLPAPLASSQERRETAAIQAVGQFTVFCFGTVSSGAACSRTAPEEAAQEDLNSPMLKNSLFSQYMNKNSWAVRDAVQRLGPLICIIHTSFTVCIRTAAAGAVHEGGFYVISSRTAIRFVLLSLRNLWKTIVIQQEQKNDR